MSSQSLTDDLESKRKMLAESIEKLNVLFQKSLEKEDTLTMKRIGSLLKQYISIYYHLANTLVNARTSNEASAKVMERLDAIVDDVLNGDKP